MIDSAGKWVLEPIFSAVEDWDPRGVFAAWIDEKWGLVFQDGQWIVEPQFNELNDFRALPPNGAWHAKLNNLWGIIDSHGGWIVEPRFENCLWTSDGRISLMLGGKWGLFQIGRGWIFQPQYEELTHVAEEDPIAVKVDGQWGLLDGLGNWIKEPEYESVRYCGEGLWLLVTSESLFPGLPTIQTIVGANNPRLADWDVETNRPYVVFTEDSCFVRRPSKRGKELMKRLNLSSLKVSEWTTFSY